MEPQQLCLSANPLLSAHTNRGLSHKLLSLYLSLSCAQLIFFLLCIVRVFLLIDHSGMGGMGGLGGMSGMGGPGIHLT